MGNSLQDQLKALGLAKGKSPGNQQATRPASHPRKPVMIKEPGKSTRADKPGKPGELSLEKAFALRQQDEKRRADQARQKKLEEDRQRKLLNNAIREIVRAHRLNRDDADIARNFMFRGRIRKIHVTPEQLKALNAGELGIAYLSGGYHLLAGQHADTIRQLSAAHVPDLSAGSEDDDEEFPIPEDLIW
jgi:uncharacterized protein YaiL (DUF2058 family)